MNIPKFKRLSTNQQRDFDCYISIALTGKPVYYCITPSVEYTAKTIEEWFFLWDTHGIVAYHKNMQLAGALTQAKDTLNLIIKMWVEDIVNERAILQPREVWEWCYKYPKWVWKSFANQLHKNIIPFRWQQINYDPYNEIYWPPEQVEFDPSI